MLCIQNALPLIRKANGDKAILSISSDQAEYPQFQNAAYAASKAGINSVIRSAARELLKEKIRANALEASTVKTNFINELGGTKENTEAIFNEENEKLDSVTLDFCVKMLNIEFALYVLNEEREV